MSTPFDLVAPDYDVLWTDTENGFRQRSEVWSVLDGLFRRGDTVLDLGCGTGDDAVHLALRGIQVVAIDSSPAMLEIARSRGIPARELAIEDLASVHGAFDGAISNFGALNCVARLEPVAKNLARLVRPERRIALCFVSRIWWPETIAFLRRGEIRKAVRRWTGHTKWRGLDIYYPSGRSIRSTFAPWFDLERRVRIGGGDHTLYVFKRRPGC